jgi:phage shock protein C
MQTQTATPDKTDPTPLPFRDDTMLGICAGLGEDLGFNPNYLRIAVGSIVLVDIMLAVVVYLGLGVAVAAARLLFPPKRETVSGTAATVRNVEANDTSAAPESLAA